MVANRWLEVFCGALLLVLAGVAVAAAGGMAEATARYEAGDYLGAFEIYEQLAEAGEAEAQYYVGLMSVTGQGVARDPQAGVTWLKRSAENGYTDAAGTLGNMYASGSGVGIDSAEAMKWLNVAASLAEQEGREPDCD